MRGNWWLKEPISCKSAQHQKRKQTNLKFGFEPFSSRSFSFHKEGFPIHRGILRFMKPIASTKWGPKVLSWLRFLHSLYLHCLKLIEANFCKPSNDWILFEKSIYQTTIDQIISRKKKEYDHQNLVGKQLSINEPKERFSPLFVSLIFISFGGISLLNLRPFGHACSFDF